MRKLSVVLFGLAACGGSSDTPADAPIVKILDAAIDARPDAPPLPPPPDARQYDYSCLGMAKPTTAADPIKVMGTTSTIGLGGQTPVVSVTVSSFKTGSATALDTVTSDATTGDFTTGNIVTGGVPLDGYVEANKVGDADLRATFVYPSTAITQNLSGIPFLLIGNTLVAQLKMLTQQDQNDTANGLLFVAVTDCSGTQIDGATIKVQQNGLDVGKQADLSIIGAQAAGTFIVENVPDGLTQVSGAFDGHTFPTHTVRAYKKDANAIPNGSVTLTVVNPGP